MGGRLPGRDLPYPVAPVRSLASLSVETIATLLLASSANATLICLTRSGFHVAPSPIAAGKHADLTPPTKDPPTRAQFDPSVTLFFGTARRSMATVVQKSAPDSKETCSSSATDDFHASDIIFSVSGFSLELCFLPFVFR